MDKIVKDYLTEKGYDEAIDETQINRIGEWLSWYKGKTKNHLYNVYNGAKLVKCELKTLNMPSQICNDKSDYIFNEKLEITIDNENVDKIMKEILEDNAFLTNANKLQQLVEALGTGALVSYLDNGIPKIDYINATNIIPLTYDNEEIIDVLFWSKKRVKGGMEYYLNLHVLTETGYVIYNKKVLQGKLGDTVIDLGESAEIVTGSFVPRFAIMRTPEVNNQFINSPYGISTYANAIDILLSVDRAYDALDNEIKLGKKRVYVQAGAAKFNTDANGNITPVFDTDDVTFYQTPDEEGKELIKESSFDLRIEELTKALQIQLNLLSKKVGLGVNGLKWENGTVTTATEIISTNSDVYRRLKKQENITTDAIDRIIHAIADSLEITEDFSVSVFYDDSIIEDIKETRTQATLELTNKLISKTQYYRDVYKLKDEEAKEFAKRMVEERIEEEASEPMQEEPEGEF